MKKDYGVMELLVLLVVSLEVPLVVPLVAPLEEALGVMLVVASVVVVFISLPHETLLDVYRESSSSATGRFPLHNDYN